MRAPLVIVFCSGLLIGGVLSQLPGPQLAQSQEVAKTRPAADNKEIEGLKASAVEFEKAFNAGDAKAIAAQFTEKAEAVDEDGNVTEGRANIEARFAALFKAYPKAKIAVELSSLRQLSPDVAIEDGYSATTLDPQEPGSRTPYTLVHVKRDGKWLVASVRDFPEEAAEATAHEQLQSLEWLVGHWLDESPEGRVETSCEWSDDGNYLLQEYVVKTRRGAVLKGTQRIAWDPLRRTIRSWTFDHSGAFTETIWTALDGVWLLKVDGVTPDGKSMTATRTVTFIHKDAFQLESTNVVVGNELLPDSSVRVVRRPPQPSK